MQSSLAKIVLGFSGMVIGLSLQGCLATRGWVTEQMVPLETRVTDLDTRLVQTNARVDGIIDRLDHLRLEKRLVLDLKEGAQFSSASNALTEDTRAQIAGFLGDLDRSEDMVFLVAGHTDSAGSEAYNYELGQRRAAGVARYLITKGVDPLRVTTVSYGESAPVTDNDTLRGRQRNRRIEILVYKEALTSAPAGAPQRVSAASDEESSQ